MKKYDTIKVASDLIVHFSERIRKMKHYTNKKYNTIAKYALLVIAASLLMVITIFRFGTLLRIFNEIIRVLMPAIWGFVLAFLLNPIMKTLERFMYKYIFKKKKRSKLVRTISVALTCLIFVALVVGLLYVVIPELVRSITTIFDNISGWADQISNWITKLFKNNEEIQQTLIDKLKVYTNDLTALFTTLQPLLENIQSGAIGFLSFIKNFFLGFIVSIYLLASKETLLAQIKKILLAVFSKRSCEKIFGISSQANKIFSGFLIGKIIDSVIIGIITFILMTILKMPYTIMISVIVGVTNIIPFFGPFIGAIPSAMLILLSSNSLKEVVIFSVMILAIQQFDGNILGPSILGSSTGLPAIWVLISIFIGGGLFGFPGMVLAVPTCAVIYDLTRTAVADKLRSKKLPTATDDYIGDVEHLYKRPHPDKKPLTPEELAAIDIPAADLVNEAKNN